MQHKTKCIVLRSIRYGESGVIITVYSELLGRLSFIMYGVKSKRARVKSSFMQPLFLLEVDVTYRPSREVQHVKEVKNYAPFTSIPFDIAKSTQAIFISEVLYRVLQEEESRPELFGFLERSVRILDLLNEGVANFHLVFLIMLSRYLGFEPTSNYGSGNSIFDLKSGCFVKGEPGHSHFIPPGESVVFSRLIKMSFELLASFKTDHYHRLFLLESIIEYYGLHLGNRLNIKSLDVFREVFG